MRQVEAKVEDYPDLIKRNGAVINTNHTEYFKSKIRQAQQNRINKLESEVCSLSKRLDNIIDLLHKLTDKV